MELSPNKYVFLVEDSKDIQVLIQHFFVGEGYKVEWADDGEQALEKLRNLPELPDLILLDLMMPNMNGYEFRDLQKKDDKLSAIPVVVMTADVNAAEKAFQMGVKGHLKKPFTVDSLLKAAATYCN